MILGICNYVRAPKTILRPADLLQGFLGLRKTVLLMVIGHCRERIQIKISRGKVEVKAGRDCTQVLSGVPPSRVT